MTYYNKSTNTHYRGGALKTADGTIFNPTEATLKAHGYEPYTPPAVEAVEVSPEDQRQQAYEAEVDRLVIRCASYRAEAEYAADKAQEAGDMRDVEAYNKYIEAYDKFSMLADKLSTAIAKKKIEIRALYPDEV